MLEVDEGRVIAYLDERTWSDYLYGKRVDFTFCTTPTQYEMTSILIHPPVRTTEVKARRRYRCINGPDHYELVEEIRFDNKTAFVRYRNKNH